MNLTSTLERVPVWRGPAVAAWRLFGSVRFAILQLLMMALLTLAGTLISQVPPTMRDAIDPTVYSRWLVMMQSQYGSLTYTLDALHLFDVFNSPWYRFLLGLLTISVVVCTVNRAPSIWKSVMSIPMQRRQTFFEEADHRARAENLHHSTDSAAALLASAWQRNGYRVILEKGEGAAHVYADRYRHSRLFTFVNHLGLIMLLAAGALTGVAGERNDGFVIPEGKTRSVGLGTNISVHLDTFTDEYFIEGGAKDYRSEVVVFDSGREVRRGTIRVNEPMDYGGVRLHQGFFGQAIVMQVRKDGSVIYEDAVPLAYQAFQYGFRPVGFFRLPSENLTIDLVAQQDSNDAMISAGQIAILGYRPGAEEPTFAGVIVQRQPQELLGLEFTFMRETQFSGLQAVKDPGGPVFFIAAALMLVGIITVFYFPPRRIWALIRPGETGVTVLIAGQCHRHPDFAPEFADVVRVAEESLGQNSPGTRVAQSGV
jgi:cytochrome c biogenesis protein